MASSGVAFIELRQGGHRLYYIRVLAEACEPGSQPLLLTTLETFASREFDVHLGELKQRGDLRVATVGSAKEPRWRLLSRAIDISGESADRRLVIPDADWLLPWLCWAGLRFRRRGLPELRLVIMRTPEPTPRIGRDAFVAFAKIALTFVLRQSWPRSRSYFLTDAFGVVKSRRGYRWTGPVRDPSPGLAFVDRSVARRTLGLPPDAFVLGLLGYVSASKNPGLTLDALRYLPPRVVALIAGRPDEPTAAAVLAARQSVGAGRVISVPGYLSETHLGQCVSACDAVMLMYDLDAPSGMLTAAVEAEIPVIAGGSPWIVRVVEQLGAGVIAERTGQGIAGAVNLLFTTDKRPRISAIPSESAAADFAVALLGT